MTERNNPLAARLTDDADIGGEFTAAQWSSVYTAFDKALSDQRTLVVALGKLAEDWEAGGYAYFVAALRSTVKRWIGEL